MDHKLEDESQILQQLYSLLFPSYPPGCDTQTFLSKFAPFVQILERFDLTSDQSQQTQNVVMKIISMLNYCFTQCPRKQLMTMILGVLAKCRGNLKNLAVGRQKIRCSKWNKLQNKAQSPILKLYAISDKLLRQITDTIYLQNKRIPHLELSLFDCSGLLQAKHKFESILIGEQAHLSPVYHHYLAIIAASTMGCKYIWNRAVTCFLNAGGNISWIEQGISSAPSFLQKMSKVSGELAYNMKGLMKTNCFSFCQGTSDLQNMLEGLIVLVYYQCLSCFALTMGLASESQVNQKYIPKAVLHMPSQKSFQIVRLYENMQAQKEKQTAEQIEDMMDFNDQQDQKFFQMLKSAKSFEDKKAIKYKHIKKLQTVRQFNQKQLEQQLHNLKYMQQLKRTFSKFVNLQSIAQIHKANRPSQNQLILASEWQWELQGLKQVEAVLGSKVRGVLSQIVKRMKVFGNETGKRITYFYQFSNNYVHQFIDYERLFQQLSSVERAYLKLITKTPFLFSGQTFEHMEQELNQRQTSPLKFALEAIGCKMELSIILITYLLDKGYEEQ